MCNLYSSKVERGPIADYFARQGLLLVFPEGIPNFAPLDAVRITDRAPIVRGGEDPGAVELVQRRWSWPGSGGKPVYNFRSEGRDFPHGRCLILADGFFEFTAHTDPKSKRKHKWRFAPKGESWFGIAGLWRADPAVGEAFTMLTCAPGPDVAPYHGRQVALLTGEDMARWLDPSVPAGALLGPLPAGTLDVEQVA